MSPHNGEDHAEGNASHPLKTISAACERLKSGGAVLIHEGTYREWVDLPQGGASEAHRLTLCAAEGERVVISGAELLLEWEEVGDGLWCCRVADSFFSGTNTLRESLSGDWFWHKHQAQHLGEVFLNGTAMIECADRESVASREPWSEAADPYCTRMTWCVEEEVGFCRVIAHFDGKNPNQNRVELSVREACVYPKHTGVNWVTLRGLEMCQAATPWAPPTAEQIGIVGPNWSKGWVIEECHIHHARCSGISLGAPSFVGDNLWTRNGLKHGSQREREIVFTALHHGWGQETVGSHLVRNCHLHHCEQTAICGHLGAVFSEIRNNHIHHIHVNRRYGGHEMAGIKLHAPIDVLIAGNHIHDCVRGIWLDWQAQGTRVHQNLMHANATEDFYTEVSHGPSVVDHNFFLSPGSVKNCSEGTAFVHNLIAGSVTMQPIAIRFTPYHMPHSTAVKGVMTILGGDDRWYNNLFLSPRTKGGRVEVEDENADLERAGDGASPFGLSCYDDWPTANEDWIPKGGVPAYASARLPVFTAGNVFAPGTTPGKHGGNRTVAVEIHWHLEHQNGRCSLQIEGLNELPVVQTLAEDVLGFAFQSECPFEEPNGMPISWQNGCGECIRENTCLPGPLPSASGCCVTWPEWSHSACKADIGRPI